MKLNFSPYLNKTMLVMLLFGFASGLPIALTASTLQAWYTMAGVSIVAIGFLTLVGQPYVYKFLWSPLMDRYIPPFLGRRRGWILITQCGLVFALLGMATLKPDVQPWMLALLALVVAFLSASQDIALDAYRADLLTQEQRGLGSALWVSGYRLGMVMSGAIALLIAQAWGWRITYISMSIIMLIMIIVTFFSEEPRVNVERAPHTLLSAIVEPFKEFFSRPYAIALLIFIIIYKLGDAFALSLSSTFYLRQMGFSLADLGTIGKTLGLTAGILGALTAGAMMVRWQLYRSLWVFGWLQSAAILLFLLLLWAGKSYPVFAITVFLEQFTMAMGSTAFVALLMALCDSRYTATQFALLSAITAIGRVFVGPAAGVAIGAWGWAWFFTASFIISLVALGLLIWLHKKVNFNQARIH